MPAGRFSNNWLGNGIILSAVTSMVYRYAEPSARLRSKFRGCVIVLTRKKSDHSLQVYQYYPFRKRKPPIPSRGQIPVRQSPLPLRVLLANSLFLQKSCPSPILSQPCSVLSLSPSGSNSILLSLRLTVAACFALTTLYHDHR